MRAMDRFDLTVTDIHAETAFIRAINLARPHGELTRADIVNCDAAFGNIQLVM
jgi:hypothetical protein